MVGRTGRNPLHVSTISASGKTGNHLEQPRPKFSRFRPASRASRIQHFRACCRRRNSAAARHDVALRAAQHVFQIQCSDRSATICPRTGLTGAYRAAPAIWPKSIPRPPRIARHFLAARNRSGAPIVRRAQDSSTGAFVRNSTPRAAAAANTAAVIARLSTHASNVKSRRPPPHDPAPARARTLRPAEAARCRAPAHDAVQSSYSTRAAHRPKKMLRSRPRSESKRAVPKPARPPR